MHVLFVSSHCAGSLFMYYTYKLVVLGPRILLYYYEYSVYFPRIMTRMIDYIVTVYSTVHTLITPTT